MQSLKDLRQTANQYWLYRFIEKHILFRLWRLFIYVLKNPFKSIWFCIKIYVLLVILTLFLVFSFSANANDFIPANSESERFVDYKCVNSDSPIIKIKDNTDDIIAACEAAWITNIDNYFRPRVAAGTWHSMGEVQIISFNTYYFEFVQCIYGDCNTFGIGDTLTTSGNAGSPQKVRTYTEDTYTCPPDGFPEYTILVNGSFCAKEYGNQNPDNCPVSTSVNDIVTTNHSRLCFGITQGGQDLQCEYEVNNGIAYVPSQAIQELQLVDCDTGSNDELPDSAFEPDPESGCLYTGGGSGFCPADPNTSCTTTSSISNGESSLNCDAGCGFIDNEFYCDTAMDRPTDQDNPCNDPVFASSNPNRCNPEQNADRNGDGVIDNSDISAQLGTMTAQNNDILSGLTQMLGAQRETNEKLETNNRILSEELGEMNDSLDGLKESVDEIKEELTGEDSVINPTIDADLPDSLKDNKHNWDQRNFATVTAEFLDGIKSSTVYNAVDNYFKISFTGTCPVYTTSIEVFGTITFDQWCGSTMASIWGWIESVIMLVFTLLATREFFK